MGIIEGFVLTFLAGSMMGGNLAPMKRMKVWRWENFWFVYSIVSLLIVPSAIAFLLIPKLWAVYASTPLRVLGVPFFCGALWGVAQLGAGICVNTIGLALTGSILNGLCAVFGTLTPLALQHSELVSKSSGLLILSGTTVMLLGVGLCGWAGLKREQIRNQGSAKAISPRGYGAAMLLAVVSGLLAALLNVALAFGGSIAKLASAQGAPPAWAVFSVWPIALAGGVIVNLGYSTHLLSRHKSWGKFRLRPTEIINPILGGLLWMLAIAIYSSGTVHLGVLGVSVGWALFQITLIMVSNLAGLLTAEWRMSGSRVFKVNAVGVAVLLVATAMIGAANYMAH